MGVFHTVLVYFFGIAIALAGGVKVFYPIALADEFDIFWRDIWQPVFPFFGSAANFELCVGLSELLGGILVLSVPLVRRHVAFALAAIPLACAVYTHVVVEDNKWQPAAVLAAVGVFVAVWPVSNDGGAANDAKKDT